MTSRHFGGVSLRGRTHDAFGASGDRDPPKRGAQPPSSTLNDGLVVMLGKRIERLRGKTEHKIRTNQVGHVLSKRYSCRRVRPRRPTGSTPLQNPSLSEAVDACPHSLRIQAGTCAPLELAGQTRRHVQPARTSVNPQHCLRIIRLASRAHFSGSVQQASDTPSEVLPRCRGDGVFPKVHVHHRPREVSTCVQASAYRQRVHTGHGSGKESIGARPPIHTSQRHGYAQAERQGVWDTLRTLQDGGSDG